MRGKTREGFEQLVRMPHGMLLVVGPTGSGKTTTLYCAMNMINSQEKKIITIEDPIEYQISGVTQMQVKPAIDLTFANGLRHIVRQDPDIILVGEIRDRETADIAINAALTGHLVLSTLHTNDAPGAITRLIDMGVEGFLIASALVGVLSQRLVRQICPDCEGSGTGDSNKGQCRTCTGTGYRSRTGIYELLTVNDTLRSAISRHADTTELGQIARDNGMIPLREDGIEKVSSGVTSDAEIARVCQLDS
jgi:general secretion pathway protein E